MVDQVCVFPSKPINLKVEKTALYFVPIWIADLGTEMEDKEGLQAWEAEKHGGGGGGAERRQTAIITQTRLFLILLYALHTFCLTLYSPLLLKHNSKNFSHFLLRKTNYSSLNVCAGEESSYKSHPIIKTFASSQGWINGDTLKSPMLSKHWRALQDRSLLSLDTTMSRSSSSKV